MELSKRETQILMDRCQSGCHKQTALKFGISRNTVNNHLRSVYRKLDTHDLARTCWKAAEEMRATPR